MMRAAENVSPAVRHKPNQTPPHYQPEPTLIELKLRRIDFGMGNCNSILDAAVKIEGRCETCYQNGHAHAVSPSVKQRASDDAMQLNTIITS